MEKHLDRSLASEWAQHRSHLFGVAYRLLGTVDEAEDVVQEAYLRAAPAGIDDVADVRAWLTTIASRLALDVLRSARVRREEYVGPWLPEPIVGAIAADDPVRDVELAESVQMAMLLVMERLRPAERVAFVLHDVFGMPFDQVADVLDRSAVACRQLASRGRRRLEGSAVSTRPDRATRDATAAAFLSAARSGELGALVTLLDATVELRTDGGGRVPAARRVVRGRGSVIRALLGLRVRYANVDVVPTLVNAGPGFALWQGGRLMGVGALAISAAGRVVAIDVVLNPNKLDHLRSKIAAVRQR